MLTLSKELSWFDRLRARFWKSPMQAICENYAELNPEKYEIVLRKEKIWDWHYGTPYHVEIWNLSKYNGRHVTTNGVDIAFGDGMTVDDAFGDLLRNIVEYEFKDNPFASIRKLLDKIVQWQH